MLTSMSWYKEPSILTSILCFLTKIDLSEPQVNTSLPYPMWKQLHQSGATKAIKNLKPRPLSLEHIEDCDHDMLSLWLNREPIELLSYF